MSSSMQRSRSFVLRGETQPRAVENNAVMTGTGFGLMLL